MPLKIEVEQLDSERAVVTFEGPLTVGMGMSPVDGQMRGLVEKGFRRLVLDLSSVPYCDSSGLGLLVQTFGMTHDAGGMTRLCCLTKRVLGVIKMSATDSFLPIDSDRATAIAGLND